MSWTNLTLTTNWSNVSGYPAARVRTLNLTNTAELEGYLSYSGSSYVDVPITTEASMPTGTYDTGNFHTVVGRCYNSSFVHVGTCEVLIQENGTLGVSGSMPSTTSFLYFGDVYPTA